ncbi:MAG: 4Fe-4S dicluster domain-containing protein [Pirellulaceae bacterium]
MKTSIRKLAQGCSIDGFLSALSRGLEVYALEPGEHGQFHLVRADRWDPERHVLGSFRQVEPLKSVLVPPREYLGSILESQDKRPVDCPPTPGRIVIGVKNCDLAGLKIQDHVFLGLTPEDSGYAELREKTILITCDCTDCLDVCFCPVVGQQPYAEKGFDINISPLSSEYLIEAGSSKGVQLLEGVNELLVPADDLLLAERDQSREKMLNRLVEQARQHGLEPDMDLEAAISGAAKSTLWSDFAADCVECGACNFVCCTCHCFQLADGTANGQPARGKQWDSCLLMNFARVAGGANPRAGRAARLRNRFQKKFCYFPSVMQSYACDGCGRCTEVCIGNIDIRAVLKRAADETESVHADDGDD